MKKLGILVLMSLIFSVDSYAQKTKIKKKAKSYNDCIFIAPNVPEFPGGEDSLMKFTQTNFNFSNIAIDTNHEILSKIIVNFNVRKSGKAEFVKVYNCSNVSVIMECKRFKNLMPKWKPLYENSKFEDCLFDLPINIRIEE
jgi:periplasmic protein TonB